MVKSLYYKLYIKALLARNPTMLFEKINHLDWYQNTLHKWINNSKLNSKTVLEVGCASGRLTQHLSDIGYKPSGVDLSINSVQLAQDNYPRLIFDQQDVADLSYADNSFNNVIAASVINIVSNEEKALSEMLRVCEKGGKISVLIPEKSFNQDQFNLLLKSLKLTGFSLAALKTWNIRAPKMELKSVQQLFIDQGVENIKIHSYLYGMVVSIVGTKKT